MLSENVCFIVQLCVLMLHFKLLYHDEEFYFKFNLSPLLSQSVVFEDQLQDKIRNYQKFNKNTSMKIGCM